MSYTTHNLQQGSDTWAAHRASKFNASDAAAMLGLSPYKTRAELLREMATGITPEIDAAMQKRFDKGHDYEAQARPWAEKLIGVELFPAVVSADVEGLPLGASLDGLDMADTVTWEHKTLNRALAESLARGVIPEQYEPQLEQGLLITGAERCYFQASAGDPENAPGVWYESKPELQETLLAGWKQFAVDLANYTPESTKAEVVAAPVAGFGALSLRVEGRVLASNLNDFRAGAEAFIARLPKPDELVTDQDFANADAAVKACAEAEDRIKAARDAAMAQMADVDAVMRTADEVREAIRGARLALDKVVKAEKENRRMELVRAATEAVSLYYTSIAKSLGEYAPSVPASVTADLGAAIKGLKSLSSIKDKLDSAVAQLKITASQDADRRREGMAIIEAHHEHATLLPDRVALVATKSADDLRNLIAARIAEYKAQREAEETAEKERQRIRDAERQRAEQEIAQRPQPIVEPVVTPHVEIMPQAAPTGARIKFGDVNARIAPLSISAEGLAQLGFQPVGIDRAAKLYAASSLPAIIRALVDHLNAAAAVQQAA